MKRILATILFMCICLSFSSCDSLTVQTDPSIEITADPTATTEPSADGAEYTYYMKDGEVLTEAREPSADAVTLYLRDACKVTDADGNVLRFDFVPRSIPDINTEDERVADLIAKMAEAVKTESGNINDVYGTFDVYDLRNMRYFLGTQEELYGFPSAEGSGMHILSDEYRYAAELKTEIGTSFTITFDGEARKLECNFADKSSKRISYCGTGLREIEVTPDKVILRGDVVTETDEDQSELDPSERMHLKADGREIVIEPYIEK